jgi:hypothetical protein
LVCVVEGRIGEKPQKNIPENCRETNERAAEVEAA